jgi:hypothetical protein
MSGNMFLVALLFCPPQESALSFIALSSYPHFDLMDPRRSPSPALTRIPMNRSYFLLQQQTPTVLGF